MIDPACVLCGHSQHLAWDTATDTRYCADPNACRGRIVDQPEPGDLRCRSRNATPGANRCARDIAHTEERHRDIEGREWV